MGNPERHTTIVVGAGASKEFGLPTGAELKSKIAKIADIRFSDGYRLSSGDYRIVEALRLLARENGHQRDDINPYLHEAWRIRDNMPLAPSIDNFLDTHRENTHLVEFGKIAIADAILKAEKSSKLFADNESGRPQLRFERIRDTWLAQLFSILVAQRNFSAFLDALETITFVSFNYDRCIHQFFGHAALNYFALGKQEVEEVYSRLEVLYPYGSVGEFNWQNSGFSNFGEEPQRVRLIEISKELRTFTEGVAGARVASIRGSFDKADNVLFLGFGFLKLNMDLLFGDETYYVEKLFATGKGLSENSRNQVISELETVFSQQGHEPFVEALQNKQDLHLIDCTCGDLIFEFQRFLLN
ncbi:hypothetical protein [Ruegeria arenilitoris]|uniref:hypothetical protein n=1 Tax=Ruegeria arenilitoris TaxID=1173585 RepID=UPI00148087CA|nr:hypothetical protein [Ruegeria arenilitoris]